MITKKVKILNKGHYTKYTKEQKIKIIEDRMQSLIKALLPKMRIELIRGSEWDFNMDNNSLTYCSDPQSAVSIDKLSEIETIGILLHEIGHAKFSSIIDPEVGLQFPKPQTEVSALLNSLEDIRVERKLSEDYSGTYDNFKEVANYIIHEIEGEALEMAPDRANLLMNLRRHVWGCEKQFKNEKVEKVFNKLQKPFEQAFYMDNTNDLGKFMLKKIWDIYATLLEDEPEQDKQQQQQNSDGDDNDGEQQEDKQSGDNSSNSNSNNKNKNKQQQKNDKDLKEQMDKIASNSSNILEDITNTLRKNKPLTSRNSVMKKVNGNKVGKKGKEIADKIGAEGDFKERTDYNKGNSYGVSFYTYEQLYDKIKGHLHFFTGRLNSILEDNKNIRFGGCFRTGKLNHKKAYKFKCNNTKIFSRKQKRMHREYNVILLIDESGSMSGDKIFNTAKATVLLSEVLNKVGIPFELYGFNETFREYKNFEQKFDWKIKRNLENIMVECESYDAGCTNDALSLCYARHNLKYKSGENIILVLTDGGSNTSNTDIPLTFKKLTKGTRDGNKKYFDNFNIREEIMKARQKNVLIGIGLGNDAKYVKDIYPQHVYLDNNEIDMLPKCLINCLRKNIKRG